jgi:hypothetical protein
MGTPEDPPTLSFARGPDAVEIVGGTFSLPDGSGYVDYLVGLVTCKCFVSVQTPEGVVTDYPDKGLFLVSRYSSTMNDNLELIFPRVDAYFESSGELATSRSY